MIKKFYKYILVSFLAIVQLSCEKDNFDEPNAILEGRVVYNGQPLSVRSNSAQLELWQDGYALNEFIPVFIAQDGTYSVSLFNGEYKVVRKGGDPWLPQLNDTIVVQVNGTTELDVPVTPYMTVSEESFEYNNNAITATFEINQIVESSNLQSVHLILGESILIDQNINAYSEQIDLNNINLESPSTVTVNVPENFNSLDYFFVRIGVNSSSSNELIYTSVQRIEL